MNIEKNKTFILNLPDVGNCYAIHITKNEKDYILVKKGNTRLFKICLNENNETEKYETTVALTTKIKEIILDSVQKDNLQYTDIDFNIEEFFVRITPLRIPRNTIPYSLYLEEKEDYLIRNEWIGKTIQITSKFFNNEVIVFIYREKNILVYGIMADLKKIAKYVFKLENDILTLIKEERYNDYKPLDFLEIKDEFRNLTTTSHEMMLDKSSKDEGELFLISRFKKNFSIEY